MRESGGKWIILRTAARCTLPLARSLAEDGFEVWAPSRTQIIHIARHNARREVTLPLLPSFLFARAHHLHDLLQLATFPARRGPGLRKASHPAFSVFHYLDEIPAVRDADLEPLRLAEHRAVPRKRRGAYQKGDQVRFCQGSFEGMTGTVSRADGRECEVWVTLFGRHQRVKINAFILQRVALKDGQLPAMGMAA